MTLHTFLLNPIVKGAISGVLAAAVVDIHAFLSWHSFGEVKTYNWGTASFRWIQGAITGALAATGLGLVS